MLRNPLCLSLLSTAIALTGCGLIDTPSLTFDYTFEPQRYSAKFAMPTEPPMMVPSIPCAGESGDYDCAQTTLPEGAGALSCDTMRGTCRATVEFRLPYLVDLRQQTAYPEEVIKAGAQVVTLKKLTYWVMGNTLSVPTPPIDLFVAPGAALDETDGRAVKLGTLSSIAAKSSTCADPVAPAAATSAAPTSASTPCALSVSSAGRSALEGYVKTYSTPFQILAHGVVTVDAGAILPTGTIDFIVQPTVSIGILQ